MINPDSEVSYRVSFDLVKKDDALHDEDAFVRVLYGSLWGGSSGPELLSGVWHMPHQREDDFIDSRYPVWEEC